MAANFDNNEVAVTLWVAFCSNRERTLDACVERTQEAMAHGSTAFMASWLSSELQTVYLNRGRDAAFLLRLFREDSPELAMGCVKAALDARMQGDDIDIEPLFTEYVARYGESPALLAARLRWLTLYLNYPKYTEEVERIMTLLAAGTEAA